MSDVRGDVRNFFSTLLDYEKGLQQAVLTGAAPEFSSVALAGLSLDALKASTLGKIGGNASYAEAMALDIIFRFDAVQRDLRTRTMRRADYYADASVNYEEEKIRLDSAMVSGVQHLVGNTKPQTGGGV